MANVMQFDLVCPERSLASVEATAVQIPGAEGDLTAMPGHAPMLTSLRPGVVRAETANGEIDFVVTRGFAEISEGSISVIAEHAHKGDEVTKADLEDVLADARKAVADAGEDHKEGAEKFLSDLEQLCENMV